MIKTEFMELYEELSKINNETDLESIVNTVATEVEKYDENGSNQNCLFSTWAVELQLRGENFLPRPVYSPRDPIFDIKGEELVVEPEVLKISSKEDVETQVLGAGDGARFYCHVNWADSKGGHEFLLINDNDSVLVVDGQAGYIKEINKDKKYFDDINFENSYIVRFDNKEINQDILKYNDEDQIVEWDDELDPKLLEEGLSQIDYLPVSDVELFKEYADDILGGFGGMSDADIKSSIKEIHSEGKLAGYIGFSEYEENGSKCLGIGNFMIIERGKGLGSAVIQNIVEKYKNQYDLIYCFVDAKNDGAIRLYKKLGKVYDEDGPNDNGEYYVTFWDNGKWELDEELGTLNEAYNIPYSGWVVVNEDGEYFSKEFLETGNLRKAWIDDIREAAVYKEEAKANKAKTYCFELYNGKLDFFIKYVESEAALEQGEIEKKLFGILEVWENFVETGVVLQKLCNQDDFKKFTYSESAYKSKKTAPDLLIYVLTSDDNVEDVVRKLGAFLQEIIKASKRSEDDQELNKKARNFIQAWNNVVQKACRDTTLNLRLQMVELLKNI